MALAIFKGLLDRAVLVMGTVTGGCVPGFLVQYRQRVGGRLDQVLEDLAPFRAIADRFHGGSIEALIQYLLASLDQTFHAEGAAIQGMLMAIVIGLLLWLLFLLIWKGLGALAVVARR